MAETEVKEAVEAAAEAVQEVLPETGDSFDLGKAALYTAGGIVLAYGIYRGVKWLKAKKEPKVTVITEPTPAQAEPEEAKATEPVEPEKTN